MPVDAIAEVWSVEATEVVKILESMQSSSGEDRLGNSSSGTVLFSQSIGEIKTFGDLVPLLSAQMI